MMRPPYCRFNGISMSKVVRFLHCRPSIPLMFHENCFQHHPFRFQASKFATVQTFWDIVIGDLHSYHSHSRGFAPIFTIFWYIFDPLVLDSQAVLGFSTLSFRSGDVRVPTQGSRNVTFRGGGLLGCLDVVKLGSGVSMLSQINRLTSKTWDI